VVADASGNAQAKGRDLGSALPSRRVLGGPQAGGAGAAFGADISGKWKGSFQGGPDGAIEQNYAFKVDGEKLTGTMSDPMLGEAKISDGKISGADLSFTVSASGQMGDMKLTFKGKVVNENEITLTFSFSGGPGGDGGGPEGGMQIALKRVK